MRRFLNARDQLYMYSPSYATGNELEDRKAGIFNRDKAGDDDDRYSATEARVVCRAKASNIKDVSTERGRDPVRRKSVVCVGEAEGGATAKRTARTDATDNETERNGTKATPS